MKRKITAFLFALVFFAAILLPCTVSAKDFDKEDSLASNYAAVFNTENGIFVYQKNSEEKIAPGSTAKIMTAILTFEHFEGRLETKVTVPAAALRGLSGSAVLNLKAGEEIPVIDLLYAMLVAGMNDAANTLAIEIGGSITNFVEMMNEKAAELGAENTRYLNPTGLASSAYTTASDTALITAHAYENERFMDICTTRAYKVAATNMHETVTVYTRNSLLTPQSEYYWKYAEAISYGYTETDGYAIVSAASYGTYPYICVAMGSQKDANGTIGGYKDIKMLLSWASNNFSERKILDTSKIICELPVRAGKDVSHVLVVPRKDVYAFLDVDADLSKITLSEELWSEKLTAPVEKGQNVGGVLVVLDGEPIGYTELIAKSSVKRSAAGGFFLGILSVLTSKIFIALVLIALVFALVFFFGKRSLRAQKMAAKSGHKSRQSSNTNIKKARSAQNKSQK